MQQLDTAYSDLFRYGLIHGTQLGGSESLTTVNYNSLEKKAKATALLKEHHIEKAMMLGYLENKNNTNMEYDFKTVLEDTLNKILISRNRTKYKIEDFMSNIYKDGVISLKVLLKQINLILKSFDVNITKINEKAENDAFIKSDMYDETKEYSVNEKNKCIDKLKDSIKRIDMTEYIMTNDFLENFNKVYENVISVDSIDHGLNTDTFIDVYKLYLEYNKYNSEYIRVKSNLSRKLSSLELSSLAKELYVDNDAEELTDKDEVNLRYKIAS